MTDEEKEELVNKLTIKQLRFIQEYHKSGNATQSWLKAGYNTSERNARVEASKALTKPNILAYLRLLQKQATEKFEISRDQLARRLKTYLDANITDYFDIENGNIKLKDLTKLTPDEVSCISSIKETREGFDIKLVDKLSAAAELIKLLGLAKQADDLAEEDNRPTVNIILKNYLQQNNQYVNQIIKEAKDKVK